MTRHNQLKTILAEFQTQLMKYRQVCLFLLSCVTHSNPVISDS